MSITPFIKMHGLGNDFAIFKADDFPAGEIPSASMIAAMSDRKRGIGCDQFIVMEQDTQADIFMHIYNPDGSRAGACGNATRCVAELLYRETNKENGIKIRTDFAVLQADRVSDHVFTVNMGVPDIFDITGLDDVLKSYDLPSPIGVNIGNNHAVFFVNNAPDDDMLTQMGRVIENHPVFPDRINVEFAVLQDDNSIHMRVWERGAGITQACGSAACATIVAAIHNGDRNRAQNVTLKLDGGDLILNWSDACDSVFMTGAVSESYKGEIDFALFA